MMDAAPIPMVLHCPACGHQHIDKVEYETDRHDMEQGQIVKWPNPPHRSHLCHECGHIWRPADVATTGVQAVQTQGTEDSPIPEPLGPWGFQVRCGKRIAVTYTQFYRNGTAQITLKRQL